MPRSWWFISILVALCLAPLGVSAQQALSCEDKLLKATARIDLMAVTREQSEEMIADTLAAVRKQRDFWQAQAQAYKEQRDQKDQEAAERQKEQPHDPQ